jgi:myo-inositol catabolism protein IolC
VGSTVNLLLHPRETTTGESSTWTSDTIGHSTSCLSTIAPRAAAPVPGFIGFAVARTSFWDALVALRDNKTTREKAVETIADRYVRWVRTFDDAREG